MDFKKNMDPDGREVHVGSTPRGSGGFAHDASTTVWLRRPKTPGICSGFHTPNTCRVGLLSLATRVDFYPSWNSYEQGTWGFTPLDFWVLQTSDIHGNSFQREDLGISVAGGVVNKISIGLTTTRNFNLPKRTIHYKSLCKSLSYNQEHMKVSWNRGTPPIFRFLWRFPW